MEPTEHEAEAQEVQEAHAAPEHAAPEHAAPHAAPAEPKRRGRPPGSRNKPKQDVPTEPAAPKRKPKPVETPAEAPVEMPAEAPAEAPPEAPPVEAPQLTREQQRALRMLERQSAYDRLTTGASVLGPATSRGCSGGSAKRTPVTTCSRCC